MTDERQAVKTLAEQLVKAMKSVSASTPSRNYTNGTTPSTISASKIVGLPAAFSSIITGIEDAAASGDAVAQMTLHALNHIAAGEFETITADTANIEKIYATFGDFITLVAEDATIGDLDVETIRAGLADVGLINIGSASIDMAQIKRSSTQTAFIHESVQGKVYIDDLAVNDASIVNLSAGTVLINDNNGNLVELYVDSHGDVSTRAVSYDGSDIINQNSLSGNTIINNTLSGDAVVANSLNGNKIVSGSITTTQLNASEIFAAQGTIMNLIADNINATRLFANQGFIPQLETTIINSASIGNSIDLSANSSITMLQDSINLFSTNTSRTFVQGSSPFPVHLSDTWFDPVTNEHYVAAGITIPNQQMAFGHDDAGNLSNVYAEDYEFTINSDGELMVLIENEDLEDIITENNIDFSVKEDGYLFASGLWNKIRNVAFSNLEISMKGVISEVFDSEKGSSRIEQNADRIIAIVSGREAVPYVKTNSIEIKEDLIEIKSSGNVDIKADNFSVSFNTEGSLPSRSRVDINNDVGIRVSDRYGGYFQANYNKIGLYDMLDTPRLYMDANGQAFFNGSLTLGGVRNTDGSLMIRNENGAKILFANKNGMEIYNAAGDTRQFYLDSSTGDATFAGNLNAAGGTFAGELSAATGIFAGELSAATGTFSGNLNAAGGTFEGTLSAACITSGTLNSERIAAKSLSVDKITGSIENGDWGIDFTNGTMKIGSATVESLAASKITGNIPSDSGGWSVDFSTGKLIIGDINATTGSFSGSLNAATGTFAGELSAATGTFAGGLSAAGGTFAGSVVIEDASTLLAGNYLTVKKYGRMITGMGVSSQTISDEVDYYGRINMYKLAYKNGNAVIQSTGSVMAPEYIAVVNGGTQGRINYNKVICGVYTESGWEKYAELTSDGDIKCNGTKSRLVSTSQYSDRLLYCYETPSPLFGDVGEGVISPDGQCYIPLDPIFAQTISTDQYQVFLQRYGEGDCYVSERYGSYFIVAGTPNLSFGWEIKAKQSDFDQLRLERNDEKFSVPEQTYGEEAASHIQELYNERTQ